MNIVGDRAADCRMVREIITCCVIYRYRAGGTSRKMRRLFAGIPRKYLAGTVLGLKKMEAFFTGDICNTMLCVILRWTIVNRTYGIHKTHIFNHFHHQYLVLLTMVPRFSNARGHDNVVLVCYV